MHTEPVVRIRDRKKQFQGVCTGAAASEATVCFSKALSVCCPPLPESLRGVGARCYSCDVPVVLPTSF